MPTRALPDGVWLAPGFIDVQVNGGGDVLFNDTPTADGIRAIAAAHRRFGTTALLPTLISDTPEKMQAALAAVQRRWPTSPACSASISRDRFSRRKSRACTTRAISARPRPRTIATAHGAAPGRHAGDAGARTRAGGLHRAARARRRARLRSAIRWRPTRRRAPPWPKGSPASRICSTPCGRWRAASPARSRRRWNRPAPGSA